MLNSLKLSNNLVSQPNRRPLGWSILFLLTIGLIAGQGKVVQAQSPETAPPELTNVLQKIDAAANSRNSQAVMQFYSPNFTHSDGLNRQAMEQALNQLWQRYPNLSYRTQLQAWRREGDRLVADTVTEITAMQPSNGTTMKLNSTLKSRQRIQAGKIVRQDILGERTLVSSGAKPPTVDIKLPTQVSTNQEFSFDAIVQEPLGADLLLGAALEEAVAGDRYLKASSYDLEPLSAGGIFKVGKAPNKAGSYWISAVLVRADGMTMVTQRLQVTSGNAGALGPRL